MKAEPRKATRRLALRTALVVVYAGLVGLVLTLGKGHTVLMDNKDSDDGSARAFESMTVSMDGQEPVAFGAGDRDQAIVRSQWHTVRIELGGNVITRKFTIPLMQDMVLLSLPRLVAGKEPALVPFAPAEEPPAPEEAADAANEAVSPPVPPAP